MKSEWNIKKSQRIMADPCESIVLSSNNLLIPQSSKVARPHKKKPKLPTMVVASPNSEGRVKIEAPSIPDAMTFGKLTFKA